MSDNQHWIERADKVIAATYGRYPVAPVRGEGCRLYDADGREYLDFLAGVAVNNLGHCHPKVVAAIQEQAATLIHCSNFYQIPQQIELAERLTAHAFAGKVFFCNSGAEANEAAIKLARKYSREHKGTDRFEILTATASFHGRTMATISATGQEKVRVGYEPVLPGFVHLPFGDIEALRKAVTARTCAVMLEPIQGEGGVIVPPEGYLQQVRELCDQHKLLLIFDEVQTGCGRTGYLFAWQHDHVRPDIMTLAKGLGGGVPIGAMLAVDKVAASFGPGSHGSTFGGNPLATAAALAVMRELTEGRILDNCVAVGAYLRLRLEQLKKEFAWIREVRGRGLMLGMELDIDGAPLVERALQRGLLINCTVGRVLRFVPPLTVNREEVDRAMDILQAVFREQAATDNTKQP
ncbi:acetylornithine aminotransferase [Geothermobacter ehrlichii]|uniref:Acetylornithine aminotransferase n=1 Tax=Geothermobacter ehrlichii TaxID=213224 RepID=A0A5D3WK37_9BACT|nr:acetylornithine transaminase [Geothermobacter ehrlichii]TYO97488.1 acetylornithine aminotransferase [Geothermobacter ehrlichii]